MSAEITGQAHRLRIFIGESAHFHRQPLYHAIVLAARKQGLAGATVMRAIEGFGPSTRIHSARLLDLSADLPILIEIVDSKDHLEQFLPMLDSMIDSGLVTIDPVGVVHYGTPKRKSREDIG